MKKVLILSNLSSGLYDFRRELLEDLIKDYEVYVSLPQTDEYTEKMKALGCKMICTPFERRGMNPLKDLGLLSQYNKLLKRIHPDIVCTYTIKPNIYGGLVCRMRKIPYISNITGLGTALQNGGLLCKVLISMYRLALKKAKVVFFQNRSNMDFMQKKGIALLNSRLLPGSGVNLSSHCYSEYPSEENGIRLLSVFRIMKDKGIEELLDVVNSLGSERVRFTLAGSYEEETREKYEPIIEQLVEENKLTYLGYVDDMQQVYESCHILVHPSYHEGMSNVCLEAAATGRIVITSDVPGCRETVVNNKSGLLIEAGSSESLKAAVMSLVDGKNHDERAKMGMVARKYVEDNFDRQIVVQMYRTAIES